MKCNCEEWEEQIKKINDPLVFLQVSRPYMGYGQGLIQFRYCPWCGLKLVEEENEQQEQI